MQKKLGCKGAVDDLVNRNDGKIQQRKSHYLEYHPNVQNRQNRIFETDLERAISKIIS